MDAIVEKTESMFCYHRCASWHVVDDSVATLLHELVSKRHLRVLVSDSNQVASHLLPLFMSLLHDDKVQHHAVAKLPSFKWLSLTGNPIPTRMEDEDMQAA
ncbi:hypothetical protein DQ04_01351100 [Trypanosoma grayi]|uniref:hypothetical protein n=1 Tax=Trypanosoma grayi TaxID=71804 RepID=UPI0004F40589|nr:hypothetical protein DQ04_01351100 [Trypanosoma grayi]KEG12887.1 hypothetical protein DQ04_01351100 [Trypanosoma grayi]